MHRKLLLADWYVNLEWFLRNYRIAPTFFLFLQPRPSKPPPRGLFLESAGNFRERKAVLCLPRLHWRSTFLKFDTMKLSFKEIKLTGLWARNRVDIQKILILKFAFRPAKFPGLLRKSPWIPAFLVAQSCAVLCQPKLHISTSYPTSLDHAVSDQISFFCPNYTEFNIVSTFLLREKMTVFLSMNFTYIFRSVILAIVF